MSSTVSSGAAVVGQKIRVDRVTANHGTSQHKHGGEITPESAFDGGDGM
jgi:hypothetical protein